MSVHGQSLVGRIFNGLSEIEDFIDAFYDAIPKTCKPKPRFVLNPIPTITGKRRYNRVPITMQQKLQAVYNCLDELDMQKAGQNLALNELKDRFFGAIGQLSAKQQREFFDKHGVEFVRNAGQASRRGTGR